jgi:hypothetical protein
MFTTILGLSGKAALQTFKTVIYRILECLAAFFVAIDPIPESLLALFGHPRSLVEK